MDDAEQDITTCVDTLTGMIERAHARARTRRLSEGEIEAVDHAFETLQEVAEHIREFFLYGMISDDFSIHTLEKVNTGCTLAQELICVRPQDVLTA